MTFTSVEIIALIVIIAAAIKMLVLLVNPKAWMNFAKNIYSKPIVVQVVGFVLAAVVLYYLIQSGFNIVQIFAVTAFVALLFLIGFAPHVGSLIARYKTQINKGRMWKENWLYTFIWVILMLWALKELFM